MAEGRDLVQMNPLRPGREERLAVIAREMGEETAEIMRGIDTQEPFVVDGASLELFRG